MVTLKKLVFGGCSSSSNVEFDDLDSEPKWCSSHLEVSCFLVSSSASKSSGRRVNASLRSMGFCAPFSSPKRKIESIFQTSEAQLFRIILRRNSTPLNSRFTLMREKHLNLINHWKCFLKPCVTVCLVFGEWYQSIYVAFLTWLVNDPRIFFGKACFNISERSTVPTWSANKWLQVIYIVS